MPTHTGEGSLLSPLIEMLIPSPSQTHTLTLSTDSTERGVLSCLWKWGELPRAQNFNPWPYRDSPEHVHPLHSLGQTLEILPSSLSPGKGKHKTLYPLTPSLLVLRGKPTGQGHQDTPIIPRSPGSREDRGPGRGNSPFSLGAWAVAKASVGRGRQRGRSSGLG